MQFGGLGGGGKGYGGSGCAGGDCACDARVSDCAHEGGVSVVGAGAIDGAYDVIMQTAIGQASVHESIDLRSRAPQWGQVAGQ